MTNPVFVLVDGPTDGDFRLLRSLNGLAAKPQVIDISVAPTAREPSRLKVATDVAVLALHGLAIGARRWRRISAALGDQQVGPILAGLPACLRWLRRAVVAAHQFRGRPGFAAAVQVVAHDLYCGVAAVHAGLPPSASLVYDSHEFQIHRNRATGLLRVLIETGLEQLVLHRANEVHLVNNAIANVMRRLHKMPTHLRISLNDFYPHHPARVAPASQNPALVYVGKGVLGRCLEALDQPAHALGFEVFTYFLGASLPKHIDGRHWHQGRVEYQQPLLELVRSRRCLMWCCLSRSSLSYQLATPNKLFQALAMGIPIVASRGTYLAELVEMHGIGTIVNDGDDLRDLVRDVLSPTYEEWVRRVDIFRTGLQDGSVVV